MRSPRGLVLIPGLMAAALWGAPASSAAPAAPASLTVDCDLTAGVTGTTITGRVGDTFAVLNAAGTNACIFGSSTGVVTATNLTGDELAAGDSTILTIVAAGTFTITPNASGGLAGVMTVVIGDPRPVPEWVITFDANGGDCSFDPLSITAFAGEWYELPTEGTGPFQCQRPDYRLIGWSHGSTVFTPGRGEQVPDVPLTMATTSPPSHGTSAAPSRTYARAEEHVTLYAEWMPVGTEITFDANVAADDQCLDDSGTNVDVPGRSTEATVYYAGAGDTLLSRPPCTPSLPTGERYAFTGWALSGGGATAFAPGAPLARSGLPVGSSTSLYAVWRPLSALAELIEVDENYSLSIGLNPADAMNVHITFQLRNGAQGWMGLIFHEFPFPADGIFAWYDEVTDSCNVWDAYNPGIPTLASFPSPLKDTDPDLVVEPRTSTDNVENVGIIGCSAVDGVIEITVERALDTDDIFDFEITPDQPVTVLAQYNDREILINEFDVVQPMYTEQLATTIDLTP